ncbi:restriction endonuclease [Desulfonatronum thioautotrophicum]|uniref:restriction endonuclease n=1 Tax=Desulfonatronum thioautotrophicum TaxID=617001 RepID=UPI0005EAD023|nr:restriction endonuclease [Desulfonatronum thioautotrophicum]
MDEKKYFVRTPIFPVYEKVCILLNIWNGTHKKHLLAMIKDIWEQSGTPQNPVDWSNPDEWIDERLTGKSQDLAKAIWEKSNKIVNPRHTYGCYLFINNHSLMEVSTESRYVISEKGRLFLEKDPSLLRRIDEEEGLPKLLSILSVHSPAKRGDILGEWSEFLTEHSRFQSASTFKDTLRRRLVNLIDRGYVKREGNTYIITNEGIDYSQDTESSAPEKPHKELLNAVRNYNEVQLTLLRDELGKMDPYKFESLVKDLLEAMDYEDVEVTKQSGDKGIDVVANFQFGITQIKEVVQVKRQQGTITRPILDQVRGSLPYYQAIRGTIITLGRFAKNCEDAAIYPGAAPITLIDGDKLVELLLKHGVGLKKKQVTLVEVDESYFESKGEDCEIESC